MPLPENLKELPELVAIVQKLCSNYIEILLRHSRDIQRTPTSLEQIPASLRNA